MAEKHGGDEGYTGLLGEGRLPKHHIRLDALGAVDEASAAFGMARATVKNPELRGLILEIQRDLYRLMSEIAATPETAEKFRAIDSQKVKWLEGYLESYGKNVREPDEFIMPGDTLSGAALDLARTSVRRAERRVVELFHAGEVQNGELVRYLNRLSSLCFVFELVEIQAGNNSPTTARGGTSS